jgi:hypothetical protein
LWLLSQAFWESIFFTMADTYKRIPRDPNRVLTTGLYEVVSTVRSGDATKLTSSQIQKMLTDSFGSRVELLWFSAKSDQKLQIQFKVDKPTGGTGYRLEFIPFLALTAVAIFATIYTLYRIKTDDPKVFELLPQKIGSAVGGFVGSAVTGAAKPIGSAVGDAVKSSGAAWFIPAVLVGAGLFFYARTRSNAA